MLLGCVSARSRTLVGPPVVLTFILTRVPFASKDCRAVPVPKTTLTHAGTESLRTPRWRKADSNSQSHLRANIFAERHLQ
jgi:hypothetical protein